MLIGVLILLPWTWWLVRDLFGSVTDVVAIALPVLAGIAAAAAFLAGRWWRPALAFAASVLVLGIAATVLPWVPAPTGPVDPLRSVRVAAANIGLGELDGARELLALDADVLVISEIGPPLSQRLSPEFRQSVYEWSGPEIGVFSRYPFTVLDGPSGELPGFRLRVDGPAGPVVVYAVHVPRPWWHSEGGHQVTPAEHYRIVELVASRAAREQLPVVVAGDLNSTDRGRDYRALVERGLADAMLESWAAPTQIGAWSALLIRIDHILVGPGWCADDVRRYPVPVSDHRGVVATVGPCAGLS